MSELGEKQRLVRETGVELDGHSYTVRIPNQLEMEDLYESLNGRILTAARLARAFTVGWNLKEIDLIPGGRPVPAKFEPDVFNEHLGDNHPALAEALSAAILKGIAARKKQTVDDEKK